jgi:uncharacterized membrane protein YjdF
VHTVCLYESALEVEPCALAVAYLISIATDNDTATMIIARVIFLFLLGFVVGGSMTFFDVGFDDVNM